jgi:Histidine phosphatase superfamily (branch 1)
MKHIVLLRHAEASKNVEHRHGGAGTNLTDTGSSQARAFARLAPRYFPDVEHVYYVARPQCYETASIITSEQRWPLTRIEGLLPFNLGVLDGLSDEEARQRYPEFARMIEEWRLGLVEISQVRISGATDVDYFFSCGQELLCRLMTATRSFIVVGTRSVLVLFWNILKNHHPRQGGFYFERPWDTCEWVEFIDNDKSSWHEVRVQRHRE